MPQDLVFYTHPNTRGRMVRWMLEEVGVPYETRILDFSTTMKEESYLAINPMGKVPALVHGETVVTETAAICAYLADAFPAAGLAPEPQDRGAYYRWLFFASGPMDAAFTISALKMEVPEGRAGMMSYGDLDRVTRSLESALSGREFVAGPRFSTADLCLGAIIAWCLNFEVLEKRPCLVDYSDRMMARPACQRAKALDDAASAELEGSR